MEVISHCTQDEIEKAAEALKAGQLVAFPTETVYGLGADAANEKAVSRVYSVKGRPTGHPLIVHISSIDQLDTWAVDIPEYAVKLAEEFWPGPMTLILKRSNFAKNFVTGGQDSVGVRVPAHPIALALLSEFEKIGGHGIAAPSANRFGAVSPTNSRAVIEEIGMYLAQKDLILDGGKSLIGVESTIINCIDKTPIVLRPGAITTKMIVTAADTVSYFSEVSTSVRTSGLFESHYAPNTKVILGINPKVGDGFIALANLPTPIGVIRLASPEDAEQFARELYEALRAGDKKEVKRIVIAQPSGPGLAVAIRDRISRAACK
jgi:L-threonylcarbamoyladenylate synthase